MESFSSAIKDQLSDNKKIESQIAQLVAALPFATNLEKVNAITTRGRHQQQYERKKKKLKNLDHKHRR
jgi:ubiquinone biosynthesis protein COQ9